MWRVVMRPALLRPPLLASGRTSDFSGVDRVISTKSATLEPRRPGVVGLYLRIPIVCDPQFPNRLDQSLTRSGDRTPEDVDRAFLQGDDGALGVLALADAEAGATGLALAVQRVDGVHLDVEDPLDRDLDLGLVGPRVDDEGVLALVEQPVGLLRDDRREQNVARVLAQVAHLVSSSTDSAFFAAAFLAGFLALGASGASSTSTTTSASAAALPLPGPARKVLSAPSVKTMSSAQSTSYVFSWSGTRTWTFSRLRRLFHDVASLRSTTTRTFLRSDTPSRIAHAVLVDGVSPSTRALKTWIRPWRARSERAPRRAAAFIFLGVRWA